MSVPTLQLHKNHRLRGQLTESGIAVFALQEKSDYKTSTYRIDFA